MIRYILVSGKAGSGKTTLAQAIVARLTQLGRKVLHTTFAAPLYDMQYRVLDVLREAGIETPKKDRVLLQVLGTEWGRATYGENIWASLTHLRATKWDSSFENDEIRYAIISDCRFVNEFNFFKDALRIRLSCNFSERQARAESFPENHAHPSEVNLDSYAEQFMFDMYFDTSKNGGESVEHCATMTVAALQKDDWVSKRGVKPVMDVI